MLFVEKFQHCKAISSLIYRNLNRSLSRNFYNNSAKNQEVDIQITERCVKQLKKVGSANSSLNDKFLRLTVEGGGCSGFQYKFTLEGHIEKEDRVFEKDGAKVIVDETSLQYVKGATIDYTEELIRAAFKVVNNPIAEAGCSCGASFAIKLD